MAQSAFWVLGIAFTMWLIALLGRVQDRSWVSPASLFALIWAAYIPTLLFFVPDPKPYVAGMVWILASVAVAWIGSAIAGVLFPPVRVRKVAPSPRAVAILKQLVRWPIAIGLADAVWLFAQRGFSLRDLFSFTAIMLVSSANRGEAYAGESGTPILERFAFTAMYLGALYGGVLFRLSEERRDKLLAFSTLLVLILINTLHGSRFGSIYGGAFWLSAYLAAHVALSDPKKGVGSGFLLRFAMAGVVIVFVFSVVTMMVRYTIFSGENANPVAWSYMLVDPFGFVAAFGAWFGQSGMHPDGPLFGARVFRRIALMWGKEYPLYDAVDVGFTTSNVFTVFRELIEDFTLWGSLELLLFYGFLGRVAFWATMREHSRTAIPLLAVVYILAFTSVATSAFAYTTIAAAALLFVVTFIVLPPITTAEAE
jgi:oligosaccharide repeat unit polymerase